MWKLIKGSNKYLKKLDEGGFALKFKKPVLKLTESYITFASTYTDRINGNSVRSFSNNKDDINAYTFSFQQAVEKLGENKKREADVR